MILACEIKSACEVVEKHMVMVMMMLMVMVMVMVKLMLVLVWMLS